MAVIEVVTETVKAAVILADIGEMYQSMYYYHKYRHLS